MCEQRIVKTKIAKLDRILRVSGKSHVLLDVPVSVADQAQIWF